MPRDAAGDRGAFIWYELMTDDPAGAKAFYDAVIGWNIESEGTPLPGGTSYRTIRRSDGGAAGGLLAISEEMKQHGTMPVWLGYIHHPDVDRAVSQLTDAGGTVHMPPMDMPGIGRMAMVADPWGATFYVMNPTPPADDPDAISDVFDPSTPEHVQWNELWTANCDAAVKLYSALFGWQQKGSMPMGELGDYLFLYRGEGMVGAVGKAGPDGPGPRWTYHIGVHDIDRAVAAVRDGGGSVDNDPMQIPGGNYSTYCRDPQGAVIGLVGPRKE